MFKKNFDTNTLPITFYAHTLQFINRSSYDKRCAVMFEAIMKDQIEMFVSGKLPSKLPSAAEQSACFASLWSIFEREGIEGTNFISEKGRYLVEVPNAELDLLLLSFVEAKEIENARNDWWEITVCAPQNAAGEEKDACILCVTGFQAVEGELPFKIKPVSRETEQALYSLYTPYLDDTKEYMGWTGNDVDAIGFNTVFGGVQVMCVGAALCCCLCDAAGNSVGYFDLGIESSFSTRKLRKYAPTNYQIQSVQMQSAHTAVVQDLLNSPNPTVIVSHWHTDHVMILNDMVNNPLSANFWAQVTIHCPGIINRKGWAVTFYARVFAAIRNAGNFRFFAYPYSNQNISLRVVHIFSNPMIYKCDKNDIGLRNPNHHDHGIYAVLTLQSGSVVFLAGDCAYDTLAVGNTTHTIINNNGFGYSALVVSHHGGRYSHSTAPVKTQYIPLPTGNVNDAAVYSANGIAFGHPNPGNVADYTNAGWPGFFTHQLLPGQNCIVIT